MKKTTKPDLDWQKWGPIIRDNLHSFMDVNSIAKLLNETGHTFGEFDEDITAFDLMFEIEFVMEQLIRGTYTELCSEHYNPYLQYGKHPCVDIRTHREVGVPKNTVASLLPAIRVVLVEDDGGDPYFDISMVLGSQIF